MSKPSAGFGEKNIRAKLEELIKSNDKSSKEPLEETSNDDTIVLKSSD